MKNSITLLLMLLFTSVASAQIPCSLDNTFDSDGKLVSDGSRLGEHVIVQSDGKILVACNPFGNGDVYIKRFNVDGSVDATYGSGGSITVSIMEVATRINGMVMHNNIIYICGTTSTNIGGTNTYPYVAAITANGAFLTTFGINGIKEFPSLYTSNALTTDNAGAIYMTGGSFFTDFYVMKLKSDGAFDNTFDSDGIVSVPTGNNDHWFETMAIVVDGNNKVLISGRKEKANNGSTIAAFRNTLVARFNTNGVLDNTFATGGIGLYNSATGNYDEGMNIHVMNGNKYMVTGSAYDNTDYDYTALKLNNNGTPDNAFGTNGWALYDLTFNNEDEYSLNSTVLPDGRILITGNQGSGDTVHFCLLMIKGNGDRDNSFAPDGVFLNIFNQNNNSSSGGMDMDANGKIVLAGYTRTCANGTCGPLYLAVSRYNNSFDPEGIESPATADFNYQLFPNPAAGNQLISLKAAHNKIIREVQVMNASGQIQKTDFNSAMNSLELTNAIAGIYFCKIISDTDVAVIRFVID